MVKAVLFDFYGVLYPDTFWGLANEHVPSRSPEKQQQLHDLIKRLNIGQIEKEEFWQESAHQFGISRQQLDKELQEYGGADAVLIDRIRSLKKQSIKTGIISNVGHDMVRSALGDDVEVIDEFILSSDVGSIKPDATIYKVACERLGVSPNEAVFFDDIPRNVRGAEAVGMNAFLYNGIHDYDAVIDELLPDVND